MVVLQQLLTSLYDAIRWRTASPDALLSEASRRWNLGDQEGGIRLCRRAAPHSADAKIVLGQWLVLDDWGPEAQAEGLRWSHQAAAEGDTRAMMMIANCHFNGIGVPKDLSTCIEWARRAADAGNSHCQIDLVKYYTDGQHAEPDWVLARHYAQMLADAGEPDVLETLDALIGDEGNVGKGDQGVGDEPSSK